MPRQRKTKICTKCKKNKRPDQFYKRNDRPSGIGLMSWCKACNYAGSRQRKMPKEWHKRYSRHWNRSMKRAAMLILCGGNDPACACCGEREMEFLSIDHITKEDRQRDLWPNGRRMSGPPIYRRIVIEGKTDGYQVLCFNCNMAKGHCNMAKGHWGTCPHKVKPVFEVKR